MKVKCCVVTEVEVEISDIHRHLDCKVSDPHNAEITAENLEACITEVEEKVGVRFGDDTKDYKTYIVCVASCESGNALVEF